MTDQEIFDKVVAHCIKQGQPAFADSKCLYRTPDGLKCAIGSLIPDDLYEPDMENEIADSVFANFKLGIKYPAGTYNPDLLVDLQLCHDEPALARVTDWLESCLKRASRVASKYGLSQKVVKEWRK